MTDPTLVGDRAVIYGSSVAARLSGEACRAARLARELAEARALWADKGTILRGNDLIGALAAHLKMTEAQVDALFGWEG